MVIEKGGNIKESGYINFASVISAISVVFLHANGCFWNFSATLRYWWTANIIECVFYFAVPVFFMISGATLLDFFSRYGLKEYIGRRVQKTVIPYIIWSLLGLVFRLSYLKDAAEIDWKYILNGLLKGNLVSIYWFFIPLFCLYLVIPLMAAVKEELKKKIFVYLAAISFVLNSLLPFVVKVFHVDVNVSLFVVVGNEYMLYLILGYLLHRYEIKRKARLSLYIVGILGLLLHIVGTYRLSLAAGELVSTYKGYNNVPCILYSTAVFVFMKYGWEYLSKVRLADTLIRFLKPYTFSMYLVHWYILQIIIKEFRVDVRSIYYRIGAPFVVVVVTVAFAWGIKKLPFGKNLLP